MSRVIWSMVLLSAMATAAWAQSSLPRSQPGESSSRDTKVDLSPPPGEQGLDLRGGAESDVQELKPWDPHKADKNIEVGDYYFKRKNFAAAISRYEEALYWKTDDALATWRLAQALEEVGQYSEARKKYQAYLRILPRGEFAEKARKALERLEGKPDAPKKSAGIQGF